MSNLEPHPRLMSEPVVSESSPFRPSEPKRGLRFALVGIGVVAVILVVMLFVAKPAYKGWRVASASSLVKEAKELMAAERWEEASQKILAGMVRSPDDPSVLRVMADFLTLQNSPPDRIIPILKKLVQSGTSTLDDRSKLGVALLRDNQVSEAQKILNAMTEQERESTRAGVELQAHLMRVNGNIIQAEGMLRRALELDRDNSESMLRLAAMDLMNPFKEVQAQAVANFWKVARSGDENSLRAIDVLATDKNLTATGCTELLELLAKRPSVPERHRLLVLASYIRLSPEQRDAVVESEVQKYKDQPVMQCLGHLRWLHTLGEDERVLKIITRVQAIKARELLILYTEALAATGKWKELQAVIKETPSLPLSSAEKSVMLARAAKGLGESDRTVRSHLQEASKQAVNDRDMNGVQQIGGVAQSMGETDIALENFRNAAAVPKQRFAMLDKLLTMRASEHNAEGMLATLQEILATNSGQKVHREMQLHLKLLLGVEMETALGQAEELSEKGGISPETLDFIRAFVAYRKADRAALVEALAKVKPETLPLGQRAVLAGLLNASGDPAKGFAIAERIQQSLLLDEEMKFLQMAL
ncbi:MAG: DUF2542 family protein [Chthoniobacteraceae bacterium]